MTVEIANKNVAGSIKVKISNKLMGDNSSANVYVSVNMAVE